MVGKNGRDQPRVGLQLEMVIDGLVLYVLWLFIWSCWSKSSRYVLYVLVIWSCCSKSSRYVVKGRDFMVWDDELVGEKINIRSERGTFSFDRPSIRLCWMVGRSRLNGVVGDESSWSWMMNLLGKKSTSEERGPLFRSTDHSATRLVVVWTDYHGFLRAKL